MATNNYDPNNYDPSILAHAMAALAGSQGQQDLQNRKLGMAGHLTQTQTPQGMNVGGTYQAASPLEHLAAALQKGLGYYQQNQALGGIQDQLGQDTGNRELYMQALIKQMLAQPAQGAQAGPYGGQAPQMVGMTSMPDYVPGV